EVYPNPTTDQLHLTVADAEEGYHYEVSNQLGQVIYRNSTSNAMTTLSIADFPAGLYMVKVVDAETELIRYAKFIKE
ncbi:MAG: T9SS type A sorting domain-containing protein, partial [Bacteroidota bacterium]